MFNILWSFFFSRDCCPGHVYNNNGESVFQKIMLFLLLVFLFFLSVFVLDMLLLLLYYYFIIVIFKV